MSFVLELLVFLSKYNKNAKMLEEDMGERYRHLLQPLRDISTNWELSIKVHLDEYLEKLKNDRERNAVAEDGDAIR